jgi:RND family efflux transporter MFP subunit
MQTENLEPGSTDLESASTRHHEPCSVPGQNPKGNWLRRLSKRTLLILGAAVILLLMVGFWVGRSRSTVAPAATITVAAAQVTREDLANEMEIPAEFRPYVEVELHAKVSGYLDKMNVDFGDKVKSGQLLATIEVPELEDQLHSAMAMQEKAEVDYTNANLMYSRLKFVNKEHPNLVAEQDLDTAESKNYAAAAEIAAAKADVERLQTLVQYTQITAPFNGVVTLRSADPGALIQAGTALDSRSLLRISDNYHLRLDFPVSVKFVKDIHLGQLVDVKVDSLGGKTYTGKVSRFTDKVSEDTRTMITEMEVENPTLEIVPGMYANVVLKVAERSQVLAIPTQAAGGQKDSTVYVVNANHEIESRPVKLGLETPEKYEVTSGLQEGELVMIGNRTLVHPGQKVDAKIVSQETGQ